MYGTASSCLPWYIRGSNLLVLKLYFLFTVKHALQFSVLSEIITRALSSRGKEATHV